MVLLDYLPRHKPWGWLRLAQGPAALEEVPGLDFAKVMGSGHGGGFSLRPSGTHQGVIALLDHLQTAQAFLQGPEVAAMRERARHSWTGLLTVESARGSWDGQSWAATAPKQLGPSATLPASHADQPLAVITRASIRPTKAMTFWKHAPGSQADLQQAPGCRLAMGLGEAPLLRQCTFSLWQDTASMQAYAQGSAHGAAARAAWRQDFFSESLFVRMRLLEEQGHWPAAPAQAARP